MLFHFWPLSVPAQSDGSIDRVAMFVALGGEEIYAALARHQQPEPRVRSGLSLASAAVRSAVAALRRLVSFVDDTPPVARLEARYKGVGAEISRRMWRRFQGRSDAPARRRRRSASTRASTRWRSRGSWATRGRGRV